MPRHVNAFVSKEPRRKITAAEIFGDFKGVDLTVGECGDVIKAGRGTKKGEERMNVAPKSRFRNC